MYKSIVFMLSLCVFATSCAQNTDLNKSQAKASAKLNELSQAPTPNIDTSWTQKVVKSDEEWKKLLTPAQYYILREQGTERAFSSPLNDMHDKGFFICAACNNPLFSSETKFNSGTGWPSFWTPYAQKSVSVAEDNTMGMTRDEISCQRCGGHLGHVFDDGPKPTGLRYCMDGDAMKFVSAK